MVKTKTERPPLDTTHQIPRAEVCFAIPLHHLASGSVNANSSAILRDSSVVLEPPPPLPTEQARSRSLTDLRRNRSKSVVFAINKTDTPEPPLPPDTLGHPAKPYRPNKRRSRTMSLEMSLSGEYFRQARDQTPVQNPPRACAT